MRKDHISASQPEDDESTFVEKYWTNVWEQQGGPYGEIKRLSTKEEYRIMSSYLSTLNHGAPILDGGCGLGDWTLALAQQGFSVVGLDLSSKTIAQLKQRFPDASFVDGDLRSTSFPDDHFDAYFSWGVFEHFESGIHDFATEALRILKPSGLLFISVPFDNLRHSLIACLTPPKPLKGRHRFYQYRFTRAELALELEKAGFDVLEVRPIHKRQGVLRSLHHHLGLPYSWFLTRALSVLMAPFVPSIFISHMLLVVARKPDNSF